MSTAYDRYLQEHISAVEEVYFEMFAENLEGHDDSKYSEEEYGAYDDYFFSGTERTADQKKAFSEAWLHHIHENPHHWEHWVLCDGRRFRVFSMPDRYVKEMVADWASFALCSKDPFELRKFWAKKKDSYLLHGKTRERVEELLPLAVDAVGRILARRGEL